MMNIPFQLPAIYTVLSTLESLPFPDISDAKLETVESRHSEHTPKSAFNKLGWTLHLGPQADVHFDRKMVFNKYTSDSVPIFTLPGVVSNASHPVNYERNKSLTRIVTEPPGSGQFKKARPTAAETRKAPSINIWQAPENSTLTSASDKVIENDSAPPTRTALKMTTAANCTKNNHSRLSIYKRIGLRTSVERGKPKEEQFIDFTETRSNSSRSKSANVAAVSQARLRSALTIKQNKNITARMRDPNTTALSSLKNRVAANGSASLTQTIPFKASNKLLTTSPETKIQEKTEMTTQKTVFHAIRKFGLRTPKPKRKKGMSTERNTTSGPTHEIIAKTTKRMSRKSRGPNLFRPRKRRVSFQTGWSEKYSSGVTFGARPPRRSGQKRNITGRSDQKAAESMVRPQFHNTHTRDSSPHTSNRELTSDENEDAAEKGFGDDYNSSPEDYGDYSYEPSEETIEEYSKEATSKEREDVIDGQTHPMKMQDQSQKNLPPDQQQGENSEEGTGAKLALARNISNGDYVERAPKTESTQPEQVDQKGRVTHYDHGGQERSMFPSKDVSAEKGFLLKVDATDKDSGDISTTEGTVPTQAIPSEHIERNSEPRHYAQNRLEHLTVSNKDISKEQASTPRIDVTTNAGEAILTNGVASTRDEQDSTEQVKNSPNNHLPTANEASDKHPEIELRKKNSGVEIALADEVKPSVQQGTKENQPAEESKQPQETQTQHGKQGHSSSFFRCVCPDCPIMEKFQYRTVKVCL